MQLTVNIQYNQLISILKNLPANQLAKVKSEIENIEIVSNTNISEFQNFILEGPVMSDEQYNAFKEHRKSFNKLSYSKKK